MTDGSTPANQPANQPHARSGASDSDGPRAFDRQGARDFAAAMARSLLDDRCEDVVILDIADHTTVTGCLVIGTGTSERQMRSALASLKETAQSFGARPPRTSADDNATWLLADFIDVVVHLFEPNARAYYDLESMWPDAQRVEPAPPPPKNAAAHRPSGEDRPA